MHVKVHAKAIAFDHQVILCANSTAKVDDAQQGLVPDNAIAAVGIRESLCGVVVIPAPVRPIGVDNCWIPEKQRNLYEMAHVNYECCWESKSECV